MFHNGSSLPPNGRHPMSIAGWRRSIHRSTVMFCGVYVLCATLLMGHGDLTSSDDAGACSFGSHLSWEHWEYGWPWTYLDRSLHGATSGAWSIHEGDRDWLLGPMALDLAVLSVIGMLGALLWERARRRRSSPIQFGIRTLILVTVAIGCVLGWWQRELQRDRDELLKNKAIESTSNWTKVEYVGPLLLRRLMKPEHLPGHRITKVYVDSDQSMADLEKLAAVLQTTRHLKSVEFITYDPIDQRTLRPLVKLSSRPQLSFEEFKATGWETTDAVVQPLPSIKGLLRVDLQVTLVTDLSLKILADCEELEDLNLAHTEITDAGMTFLPSYPQLEFLDISNTEITDAGLRSLAKCESLVWIIATDTRITAAGKEWFSVARPDLTLYCDFY